MVSQAEKKNHAINIVFRTFTVFWHNSDVISTISFHYQMSILAIKPPIKVDFYLYIKYLVHHNTPNKITGWYTIFFFVINLLKLRHNTLHDSKWNNYCTANFEFQVVQCWFFGNQDQHSDTCVKNVT